jgi:hypothetical protein
LDECLSNTKEPPILFALFVTGQSTAGQLNLAGVIRKPIVVWLATVHLVGKR